MRELTRQDTRNRVREEEITMDDVRPDGAQFYRHERRGMCVEGERIATEVRESMNHPDTASFMAAQITIANWCLDRALQASGDTSSRYLRYARQAYDIVVHLLPEVSVDETSQRVHQQLSVLRQRLQVAEKGPRGGNAHRCVAG
jgi:hypothetical protein